MASAPLNSSTCGVGTEDNVAEVADSDGVACSRMISEVAWLSESSTAPPAPGRPMGKSAVPSATEPRYLLSGLYLSVPTGGYVIDD